MKTTDFEKGDKVTYIPGHAHGDINNSDCENGVVSSTNHKFVFVKYNCLLGEAVNGDEPWTAKATSPEDLIKL